MKQIKAKIKFLVSFIKSEWNFDDYPLETWSNPNAQQADIKFGAGFTNWSSFVAHGNTISEAVKNLKAKFKEYSTNNKLPRPGSTVPIQFEKTDKVDKHESIAIDFFDKIIGINYYDCFISDQSSLFDFELDDEGTIEKIRSEYGIEPDRDLILVDIFEQIRAKASA